jgi:hypothetical protein
MQPLIKSVSVSWILYEATRLHDRVSLFIHTSIFLPYDYACYLHSIILDTAVSPLIDNIVFWR